MKKPLLLGAGLTVICLLVSGCVRPKEPPRVLPIEGVFISGISALAFCDEGNSFVSVTEDGQRRLWDIFSGSSRILEDGEEVPGLTSLAGWEFPDSREFPVLGPDGTKKILPSGDGGVCLADAVTGKELARYYGFTVIGTAEWISIAPEGFYNASFRGSSFLSVETRSGETRSRRYPLDRLSGALYRPDLFTEKVRTGAISNAPLTLESLLLDECLPPLVSLSIDSEGEPGVIKIKIIEQKGGTGLVALYSHSEGLEIPAGLFNVEEKAARKFTEKRKTCYEINLDIKPGIPFYNTSGPAEIGVSVFNKNNTVESQKVWTPVPGPVVFYTAPSVPSLRVLLALDKDSENAAAEFLSFQAEGDLYGAVEVKTLFAGDFSKEKFSGALEKFCAASNLNDTVFIYLKGRGAADSLGNLQVLPGKQGEEISGDDLLKLILSFSSNPVLLLDLESSSPQGIETALLRFRHRLGPKAMFAAIAAGSGGDIFISSIMEVLKPNLSGAVLDENRFMSTVEFFNRMGQALAAQGSLSFLNFPPGADFPLADIFINTGELKFQTMTSGMLKIDRVDGSPIPLTFGDTMIRRLPPGSYIIDMMYRNGYRETRFVDLRIKDSTWVIFNYTPALLTGNYSGTLPSGGINIAELNPANYQKINREAMEAMGMAPYYVAFLAGEKFYREENYDGAIAEYTRAISLKSDYTDAFVSRGNARRKKGDLDRAIDDYTRAITLSRNYAEVYNYRGFMYSQKGNLSRAVEDYTQAIRYRADYGDAYFNRAYIYSRQEKWDEAIADYTQVIKLEPSNALAYNARGNAWQNKGDEPKASADFLTAEKLKK